MRKEELLQEYENELKRIGKSQKTIDGYLFNINKFLDWLEETGGEPFTGSLTPIEVKSYTWTPYRNPVFLLLTRNFPQYKAFAIS